MVVVRLGKDGSLKNSYPCNHCINVLKFYNIKKIIYSSDTGIIINKINDLNPIHISSGWNAFNKFNF